MVAPVAPWTLTGEALVGLVRGGRSLVHRLPPEVRPLPGPTLVMAAAYEDSPVGPYIELVVGRPARLGLRVGWCMTVLVCDSPASRMGGILNWGFPEELGSLTWEIDGDRRQLRWAERDLSLTGEARSLRLPVTMPGRAIQRRSDGPVVVPASLRGRARFARLDLACPDADPMAGFRGRHLGCHIAGVRVVLRPARHPSGLVASFLAPLRAPGPALSFSDPGRLAQR